MTIENIVNLSGKTINIFAPEDILQTPAGAMLREKGIAPILVIPSAGEVRPYSGVHSEIVAGVPVIIQRYVSVDNPASLTEEKNIIVSNLYASIARSMGIMDYQFYTVYRLIKGFVGGGKIYPRSNEIGCVGLEAK